MLIMSAAHVMFAARTDRDNRAQERRQTQESQALSTFKISTFHHAPPSCYTRQDLRPLMLCRTVTKVPNVILSKNVELDNLDSRGISPLGLRFDWAAPRPFDGSANDDLSTSAFKAISLLDSLLVIVISPASAPSAHLTPRSPPSLIRRTPEAADCREPRLAL
jgi:hypothetical protein